MTAVRTFTHRHPCTAKVGLGAFHGSLASFLTTRPSPCCWYKPCFFKIEEARSIRRHLWADNFWVHQPQRCRRSRRWSKESMKGKMRILIAYDGSKCADAALADLRRAGLP